MLNSLLGNKVPMYWLAMRYFINKCVSQAVMHDASFRGMIIRILASVLS